MQHSRIQAVDHVTLEGRPGDEAALQWFYGEVAKLDPVPGDGRPQTMLCFRSCRLELRVRIVEEPDIDPIASRAVIAVPSLEEAVEQLEERKVPYERLTGLAYTDRRIAVRDVAGNRIELKQEWAQTVF